MVAHSRLDDHDNAPLSSSSPTSSLPPLSSPSSSSSSASPGARAPVVHSESAAQRPSSRHPDRCLASPGAPLPTHFPPFRCQKDFLLITRTASMLECCGFYWGPLGVEEAHNRLRDVAVGTFLIRDSRQKDVFFTLSYRAASGPVSVRIVYKGQRFGLAGSEHSFPCLFTLLEHYITSPKRSLSAPYRKQQLTLQELCRRRIIVACGGGDKVEQLPINPILKDFLSEFPYRI